MKKGVICIDFPTDLPPATRLAYRNLNSTWAVAYKLLYSSLSNVA
jgi:hypothetical protein